MPRPEGKLTRAQHEIMEVVWSSGRGGSTVAQIWEAVSLNRKVARTTVLNLVDRLEKRAWLKRRQRGGIYRYTAAVNREDTSKLLAGEFVNDFFGGSATDLVMSLLGSKQLSTGEIDRLRRLVEGDANDEARHTTRENETS
ncbi:MAG: BlaI/MecI/CopY family transcriptional regulator [Planctomycetaceae bacterium]|nr:BlaI/MecI/CopY family transcriptional regulator [Planctomycetaceae bacterium]MBT6483973.1 BlaI/MecI/CopY family transcriptional regulator [Planctomycetaceae bacterium]MBT6496919.1 BlaI/MecI/CopY family transcriptional regulator [Planctomycetaceae bacterium]